MYDQQSQVILENAFKSGAQTCDIDIQGTVYVIDFQNNKQVQANNHTRRRNIRRDGTPGPGRGQQNNYTHMMGPIEPSDTDFLGRVLCPLSVGHVIVTALLAFIAYIYLTDSVTSSGVNEKSSEQTQINKQDAQINRWARGSE